MTEPTRAARSNGGQMKVGRLILIEFVILVLLALVAGGVYYLYWQGQNYVSSSDAQVGANLVTILSPATGKVTGNLPQLGQKEKVGGRILNLVAAASTAAAGSKAAPGAVNVPVAAPVTGYLAALDVVPGQEVAAGQPIGQIVAAQGTTVTAYILETSIHSVKVGQFVDVYLDAYPNDTFPGHVQAIVPATQASLSLLPSTQSSGSFTKVTQRVPVVIQFENPAGAKLYAGMSAEVRVHINGNQ